MPQSQSCKSQASEKSQLDFLSDLLARNCCETDDLDHLREIFEMKPLGRNLSNSEAHNTI